MRHSVARSLISLATGLALIACGGGSKSDPAGAPTPRGVTSDDVQRSPSIPIEQLLQSKVPGILVSRTEDGGVAIRIRNTSTFSASSAPLYVIDGIPTQASPSGGIPGINPYDIDTIKVLKDPADLSMYGSRGANGVIVIKTKRGSQ